MISRGGALAGWKAEGGSAAREEPMLAPPEATTGVAPDEVATPELGA